MSRLVQTAIPSATIRTPGLDPLRRFGARAGPFLIVSFGVCACVNIPEVLRESRLSKERALVAEARDECKKQGLPEGTETFSACVQRQVVSTKQRSEAASQRPRSAPTEPIN